jgi:hypothetical protein
MPHQYIKSQRTTLRLLGQSESWLQDRIAEDPSILGLGDLALIRREKKQVTGGRIDFLLADQEEDVWYEVEVMLGKLDESHIIRTIEYWDVERTKNPNVEHRAVIVAEDITNRFFNVISLLNRAIPLIAVQMTAVKFEERFVLTFTKVLDVVALRATQDQPDGERKDRAYWDTNAGKASLAVVDGLLTLLSKTFSNLRVVYNQGHIAIGTTGNNFLWAYPRKNKPHCFFDLKLDGDERSTWVDKLAEVGVYSGARGSNMKLRLNANELSQHSILLSELLVACEGASYSAA